MLLYRVFPYIPGAVAGAPGSGEYLHKPQGAGRLDNPRHYDVWYLATEPAGAIAEVFGDQYEWSNAMFPFPKLPGSNRALGTYSIPDGSNILDLDDARELVRRGLRPTQIVERNRAVTQQWALDIFNEKSHHVGPMWDGVRWWSFHRPSWGVIGLWGFAPTLVNVDPLDVDHIAVKDAANSLSKRIT
jgi:hypothetical protein